MHYIVAVDKFGHFGKAARHCHVSQPSLSALIHKLEDELGVVIFDRSQKPVLTTELGRAIVTQARRTIEEARKLEGIAKHRDRPTGELKLGVIPTISPYLVPRFIAAFSTKYPGVSIFLEELQTAEITRRLRDESLDAGILATPLEEPRVHEKVLYYEPFFIFTHQSHQLYQKQVVQESELSADGAWLLKDGHCLRKQMMQICQVRNRSGCLDNLEFESGHLETLKSLVRATGGYTLLPSLAVSGLSEDEEKLVRPFVAPAPTREVSLVYTRTEYKRSILDLLCQEILEALPKKDIFFERGKTVVPPR